MGIERMAEFATSAGYASMPPEAIRAARQAVLDYLGVAVGGSDAPVSRIMAEQVKRTGARAEAGVIGGKFRTSADLAAWANGTIGHALDYDDTFSVAADYNIHPSVPIFPAVFALGEKHKVSGRDVLAAYIVGIEIESRIGTAIGAKSSELGWHPTAVLGTVAAAAASANLLKLSARQAEMALAIATSLAGGIMGNIGTMTKPMHGGNAARSGVVAAQLAGAGFTGNEKILEGENGFCRLFSDGSVSGLGGADSDLGEKWHIVTIGLGFKPYPSCRGTHASIDAALHLRQAFNLKPDEVESVTCNTFHRMGRNLRFPRPTSGYEAKFSMHYCVSTALLKGKVTLEDFRDENVGDAQVQGYLPRVSLVHPKGWPLAEHLSQEVVMRLKNGKELTHKVMRPKGDSKNPMTDEELIAKFRDCAGTKLKAGDLEKALDMILHIDGVEDITRLADILTDLKG